MRIVILGVCLAAVIGAAPVAQARDWCARDYDTCVAICLKGGGVPTKCPKYCSIQIDKTTAAGRCR